MTESQRNHDLSIQECSDRDADEWNAAAVTLGGSFYHLWQWRQINRESLGHLTINLAARRDGAIVGLLPLAHVQHLYWEMIRDACEHGHRTFHLGRSTAQATQLYWYYFKPSGGEMPRLNVTNPKYQLAIRAWRHMPLWCTRRIGPPPARGIP